MKKILAIAALAALSVSAFAQSTSGSTTAVDTNSNSVSISKSEGGQATGGTANSVSQGGAGGTSAAAVSGVNASNGLTVGCLVNCASTDQGQAALAAAAVTAANINAQAARDVASTGIKNTPNVSGPALTSSNDTCMGSSSGSANVPGVGLSFGSSWVDGNCRMLKNSRELWNMGMKAAAMALMCSDKDNREALELTGFECPQAKKEGKKTAAVQNEQYTDPIVRDRLGLPALASASK